MTRTDLTLALAAALFAAFLLGFVANWIIMRLSRPSRADVAQVAALAQSLEQAEQGRIAAEAARAAQEQQLTQRIRQAEAELQAATDDLKAARAEVDDLRRTLAGRS